MDIGGDQKILPSLIIYQRCAATDRNLAREKGDSLFEIDIQYLLSVLPQHYPIKYLLQHALSVGLPCGSEVKASAWNAGGLGSIPELGRSPGEGNGSIY